MTAGNLFNTMDAALNDEQHATVQYSLDKTSERYVEFCSRITIPDQQTFYVKS